MSKIIDFSRQQVGEPYVFGASGMDKWDCSGLTKTSAKQIGLILFHGATTQWNRGIGIIDAAARGHPEWVGYFGEWGTIESLPNKVAFLFNQDKSRKDKLVMGHTGLYDGGGYVIQAGGQYKGVSDKPINKSRWSHWGTLTQEWMDKDMSEIDPFLIRRRDKGEKVKKLQEGLLSIGYKLPIYGADGDFGAETLSAVEAFQRDNGVILDGVWDSECQKILEEKLNIPDIPDGSDEMEFLLQLRDIITMRLNAINQV